MYDLKDSRWVTKIGQIKPTNREVMLTFDDGPGRHLPAILDVLYEKKVQALFFWQSRLLYHDRPWKRVIEEGHKIGSHGHNHKNLATLTKSEQYKQIKTSVDKIEEITTAHVSYFRPPFGQYNEETMDVLEELNLIPVMWDITSYDWECRNMPESIIDLVTEHVREGSIILLHELEQTAEVLPPLIDEVRKKGYTFALI